MVLFFSRFEYLEKIEPSPFFRDKVKSTQTQPVLNT